MQLGYHPPPLHAHLYRKCSHSSGSSKDQNSVGTWRCRHLQQICQLHFVNTLLLHGLGFSLIRINVKCTLGFSVPSSLWCEGVSEPVPENQNTSGSLRIQPTGANLRRIDSNDWLNQDRVLFWAEHGLTTSGNCVFVCVAVSTFPYRFFAQLSLLSPPVFTSADQAVVAT